MEFRDDGTLVHDGVVLGEFEDGTLTLQGGWMTRAGVRLEVLGDPKKDKLRTVLSYPKKGRTVDSDGVERPGGTVLTGVKEGQDATAGGASIGQKASET